MLGGDHALRGVRRFHGQFQPAHHALRLVLHAKLVYPQKRLAFRAVDNHALRRNAQLYVRGEARAPRAHNARAADGFNHGVAMVMVVKPSPPNPKPE